MPEISRFLGIVVHMYFQDHAPPHFHARYGEHQASIAIADGSVLAGSLPARALALAREWAALRERELADDWRRAEAGEPLVPIAPLD